MRPVDSSADIFPVVQLLFLNWPLWLAMHVLLFNCITLCAKKQKPKKDLLTQSYIDKLPPLPVADLASKSLMKNASKEGSVKPKEKEAQKEKATVTLGGPEQKEKNKEKDKEGHDDREEAKELANAEKDSKNEKTEESKEKKSQSEKVKMEVGKMISAGKKEESVKNTQKTETQQETAKSKEQVNVSKESDNSKQATPVEEKSKSKGSDVKEASGEKKEQPKSDEKKSDNLNLEISVPDIRWKSEEGQSTFKMTNTSGKRMAYKIKTTDATIYSVAPVYFFMDDGGLEDFWRRFIQFIESKNVTVVRQKAPFKEDQLAIVFCKAGPEDAGSAEVFKKPGAKSQHKILAMLKK